MGGVMRDLKERLRGHYTCGPFGTRDFSSYIPAISIEAADYIEQLEQQLADANELIKQYRDAESQVTHDWGW